MMKGEAPTLRADHVPTCVRWAEHDPLFPYAWTDRLGETFAISISRCLRASDTFRIARIPIARARRSQRFFKRIGWS